MTHIEDVARIRHLESKDDISMRETDEFLTLVQRLEGVPLAVIGQFHDGDVATLDHMMTIFDRSAWQEKYKKEYDCLCRMLAAARIMEGGE